MWGSVLRMLVRWESQRDAMCLSGRGVLGAGSRLCLTLHLQSAGRSEGASLPERAMAFLLPSRGRELGPKQGFSALAPLTPGLYHSVFWNHPTRAVQDGEPPWALPAGSR